MRLKLLSMLLSVTLLAGSVSVPVTGSTEDLEKTETTSLEQFAESIDVSIAESESAYANKRLIVTSDTSEFDVCGAVSVVSYDDIYVLSYGTETDCGNAYEILSGDRTVSGVEIDRTVESAEITESTAGGDEVSEFLEAGEGEINTSLSEYLKSQPTDRDEVKVAVLDSGICTGNTEFQDRIIDQGLNFSGTGEKGSAEDDFGHGTVVSSRILEHTYSNVKLIPVKVTNASGKGSVLSLYLGIKAAIQNNADIINISLTCNSAGASILKDAIQEAAAKGITVVAAAGNDADDAGEYMPANIDGVLTIASVNSSLERSEFSNYGECIDYVMQGEGITCTGRNDSAEQVKGTSYSAAAFTSLIAQLKGADRNRTTEEMLAILDQYVIDLGEEGFDSYYGNGLLSYDAVVTDENGDSQTTDEIITELDINDVQNWEDMSDQKLQEYIFYGSDENNARFLAGLSQEELTELLKRDTDFKKDVDYDGYDGTYYEYLVEEVKGASADKYGDNCFDNSYSYNGDYFDRKSGYFYIKVTGGGKGTVTAKIKVEIPENGNLKAAQKKGITWSIDKSWETNGKKFTDVANGADGYNITVHNDSNNNSSKKGTLGDNDPDPDVNTHYTYRGTSERSESKSSPHYFVFVGKFSITIPQHYHLEGVEDSFKSESGNSYADNIARINSNTYSWDNHRYDAGDYGTHDHTKPNLNASGITDYFAMNLGAVALGLKKYSDGSSSKYVHATRTIKLTQDASYTLTLNKGTGVKSVSAAASEVVTIVQSSAANGTGTYKYYAKTDSNTFTSVNLNAVLETGYHWVNWTGYTTKTEQACTISMNTNKTFTANAAINEGTYIINANGGRMAETDGIHAYTNSGTGKVTYFKLGSQGNVQSSASESEFSKYSPTVKYNTQSVNIIDVGTLGIKRTGYHPADGKEYIVDGTTTTLDQAVDTAEVMKKLLKLEKETGNTVTLKVNWEPDIYTVTLDNQLTDPEAAGTKAIYEKYENGWFFDKEGKKPIAEVVKPKKTGYKFLGYFTEKTGGTMMIKADGQMVNVSATQITANSTWYAHYEYLIGCEDYADVPCDFEKTEGDTREDVGALLTYDSKTGKVTVDTGRTGCTVRLSAKPVGTAVGQFQSTASGTSISGRNPTSDSIEFPLVPAEGAAYQLKILAGTETVLDRVIYFKDGRFRTLVKLGTKEEKTFAHGTTVSGGKEWGTEASEYDLYRYRSCTEIKNVSAPGTVYRYFTYKDVNMAYSGNGATSGTNILEYDVSLENMYQFRENGFAREETVTKHTADKQDYRCDVKYSFEGWKMVFNIQYQQNDQDKMIGIYKKAENANALSNTTTDDISTYQSMEPIAVTGSIFSLNAVSSQMAAQSGFETVVQTVGAGPHASEYINLLAQWNAFPTIVVTPGDSLEFYEGEDVTKDDLISHLTAHDSEDNRDMISNPDLNDKIQIIKIVYPKSENGSQEAYEKEYETDVPEDFLLDTYYLKLEKDETVNVLVTFAVTDSNGNTTEEEIPVKVKYNNPPEINCDDEYYYLKEEANRGELTAEAMLELATADDVEDGDITTKLELVDFDPQELKMQTRYKEVFPVTYQVTDAYKKTTIRTVNVMVWDEDAYIAEQPKYYVRYISEKYLDTFEENSVWREPENMAYLVSVLQNTTPKETWYFTHEDVLAVQDWITEDGDGHWKFGQEANREFLRKFAYCKQ